MVTGIRCPHCGRILKTSDIPFSPYYYGLHNYHGTCNWCGKEVIYVVDIKRIEIDWTQKQYECDKK
jgi:hypothetical protein